MAYRILRGQKKLMRFHIHESALFAMPPQTSIINSVVLDNHHTKVIKKEHEVSLQRSFDTVLRNYEGPLNKLEGKELSKLLIKAYRPFLSKPLLNKYFNSLQLQELKQAVRFHTSLRSDAIETLRNITVSDSIDFGILRGEYFVSLGILRGYSRMLDYSDEAIFKGHHKMNVNYTEPLSRNNPADLERSLEVYLRASSRNNSSIKNYIVVNSPVESEIYSRMASKFGSRIIVMTEQHFSRPSSTIEPHLWEFESLKRRGDIHGCEKIQKELSNLKFIALKNMKELNRLIMTLTPMDLIGHDVSFDQRLKEMEFDIMGHED